MGRPKHRRERLVALVVPVSVVDPDIQLAYA